MLPDQHNQVYYDQLVITNQRESQIENIKQQCQGLGIPADKIKLLFEIIDMANYTLPAYDEQTDARVSWLRNFANYVKLNNIQGNVAECGVNKGDFAYYINKYFSDRKCYLYDSFEEGFRKIDVESSLKLNDKIFEESNFNRTGRYPTSSVEIVLNKMLFPNMCEIHKGYIPESAEGLKDEFCFVNLDMDLYQPMLEGLKIFYPMMVKGGVILIHDYFNPPLAKSVRMAIANYEKFVGYELCKLTIGDFWSIAIIKR